MTEGVVGLCCSFIELVGQGAEDGGAFGTELQYRWLVGEERIVHGLFEFGERLFRFLNGFGYLQ